MAPLLSLVVIAAVVVGGGASAWTSDASASHAGRFKSFGADRFGTNSLSNDFGPTQTGFVANRFGGVRNQGFEPGFGINANRDLIDPNIDGFGSFNNGRRFSSGGSRLRNFGGVRHAFNRVEPGELFGPGRFNEFNGAGFANNPQSLQFGGFDGNNNPEAFGGVIDPSRVNDPFLGSGTGFGTSHLHNRLNSASQFGRFGGGVGARGQSSILGRNPFGGSDFRHGGNFRRW